jgi:hypothetical protein
MCIACLPAGANLHECLLSPVEPLAVSSDKISTCIQYSIVAYLGCYSTVYVGFMYIWNWINAVNASRVVTGRDLSQTKVLWDGYVPPKNIENIPVHTINIS